MLSLLCLLARYHHAPARAASRPALAIQISAPGVVRISDQQLEQAGWDLPLPRERVALGRLGAALALSDTGAGFAFVAEASQSRSSAEAVYWLTVGDLPALRQELPAQQAQPLAWAPDRLYERHLATAAGDSWWAGELRGGGTLSATLDLHAPIAANSPLQLFVRAAQPRAGHALHVSLAGQPLGSLHWDDPLSGAQPLTLTLSLPAYPTGPLPIELSLGAPDDWLLVDGLALPTIFPPAQAAAYAAPRPVLPLPNNLAGADLLVVSHADFLPALGPLLAAHAARGQRAVAVDVQAAYDRYTFGEREPEAIRSLVRAVRPGAVLLVGAGTAALRLPHPDRPTFIPPYLVRLPRDGELACDTCYARLNDGPPTEQALPDLPVGRWPVASLAETQALVAKTVARLSPPPGAWRARVLALADNDVQPGGELDPAGSFTRALDAGLAGLPRGVAIERLYYAPERQAAAGPYEPDVGRLRCRLFRQLDGGRAGDACAELAGPGVALWIYTGHGSPWQWASTTPEAVTPYLWYLYDADRLRNGARLPIALALTCLSGDFANPVLQSNDERLLLRAGGGVVAILASSGEGVNTGHAPLLAGMLARLYATGADRSLGAAHLAGLERLPADARQLAFAFGILGDPLVALPFVPRFDTLIPLVY